MQRCQIHMLSSLPVLWAKPFMGNERNDTEYDAAKRDDEYDAAMRNDECQEKLD